MAVWAKAIQVTGLAVVICAGSARAENLFRGGDTERTIVDPATGQRWALLRDSAHPGGPGRLEPLAAGQGRASTPVAKPVCVIRAGDRIVVEEHTSAVDLSLEAVAMHRAAEGEGVRARLVAGGAVVMARAGCDGRTELTGRAAR